MKIQINDIAGLEILRKLQDYHRLKNEIEYKYFTYQYYNIPPKEDEYIINEMRLDYKNKLDRLFSYFIERKWFLVVEKINNSKKYKYYVSDKCK